MTPDTHMIAELERLGIQYKLNGENILVKCEWHDDSKPSLSIHQSGKMANCWACSWSGNWNKYAHKVGAQPIDESTMDPFELLDIREDKQVVDPFKTKVIPRSANKKYTENWRGISKEFIKKIDGRLWFDDVSGDYRILFPVVIKRPVGYVAARIDPNNEEMNPKYRNSTAFPSSSVLYPYNLLRGKSVFIVEGPFDAIRLCSYGLPAVCTFGTQSWSSKKEILLMSKGIENVYILFDGDDAGKHAAVRLERTLRKSFPNTYIIDLPNKEDPGSVDESFLDWLKTLI